MNKNRTKLAKKKVIFNSKLPFEIEDLLQGIEAAEMVKNPKKTILINQNLIKFVKT